MTVTSEWGEKIPPKKTESIQVKPLATIAQLLNSEVICGVGVRALKKLAEKFSPEVFARVKDLRDSQTDDALAALLSSDLSDMSFVEVLGEVAPMVNEEGIALLEERDFRLSGTCIGDAVASAYIEDRGRFRKAFARRLGDEGVRGTYYFRRSERLPAIPKPREISDELKAQAEQDCIAHFSQRNCGPTTTVRTFKTPTQVGFVITHGGIRSGKAVIDRKEQRVPRFDRPEKTDVVIFDSTTRLAWIMALKGDHNFYAALLGRALFGDERTFSGLPFRLNLDFAKARDLPSKLKEAGGVDVQTVQVKLRKIEGLPNGDLVQPAGKNECVTEKYLDDPLNSAAHSLGVVTTVKLNVVLNEEKSAGGTITLKEYSIGLPANLPETVIKQVLFDLGVMSAHGS